MGEASPGGGPLRRLGRWFLEQDSGVRSVDGHAPVDSLENRTNIARFAVWMAGTYAALGSAVLVVLWAAGTDLPGLHLGPALIGSTVVASLGGVGGTYVIRHFHLLWVHAIAVFAVIAVFVVGMATGPNMFIAPALAWVITVISVSVGLRPRAAVPYIVLVGISCAVLMSTQDGYPNPAAESIGTVGGILIIARAMSWIVERIRVLAADQRTSNLEVHAARAVSEELNRTLEDLNRTLEQRVEEQVQELGRFGRLQRFLPAPLVDAVMSGGEGILEPHRARIAVFFCDVRGFSAFAASAGPEDVHELLGEYYAVLGEHAKIHEATVGAFTGDGLMAFFNDPLPCPDPVDQAVRMAVELQGPINRLLDEWRAEGHVLGFGVGIAYGWANIGMIGFEGRRDYTALGSVVNIAAHLCVESPTGGILVDSRAHTELADDRYTSRSLSVRVKGFEQDLVAYNVSPALHS